MAYLKKTEWVKIYCVTGYYGVDYHNSRVAFSIEEARAIAAEMESEELYRWIHIRHQFINTERRREALETYFAAMGM